MSPNDATPPDATDSAATDSVVTNPNAADAERRALPAGLLADLVLLASRSPSPHNTQPWSPRIDGDTIEVAVVPSRTLPAGDPTFRDVIMSLGAWLESVAVGAAEAGFKITVDILPALSQLDTLPIDGPADPALPVFCVRLAPQADAPTDVASTFRSADVRERRVYRGTLSGRTNVYADLDALALPSWLSLRTLDNAAMGQLSRRGIAFTASRESIARELLHWLRLDSGHPRYSLDGMTDDMLLMPRWLARAAAPFTRTTRLRNPALKIASSLARLAEGVGSDAPLPPRSAGETSAPTHHVLVANARAAGVDDLLSSTESMDSRIGVTEAHALEAGRVLQRLWLHAHRQGLAVSPHSELIDSPAAHGALRGRLGLRRGEVALAVFSAGVPQTNAVPRSPRLTDSQPA
jgi:nitroreductase